MVFRRPPTAGGSALLAALFVALGCDPAIDECRGGQCSAGDAGKADMPNASDCRSVGVEPLTLQAVPLELFFVLDRSGSMGASFEDDKTRWQVLRDSLKASLPKLDKRGSLGLLIFPQHGGCDVADSPDLPLQADSADSLLSLLETPPEHGGTPLQDALQKAGNYLQGAPTATYPRAIVLGADGVAGGCSTGIDQLAATVSAIRKDLQVNTLVFGLKLDNDDARQRLNEIAEAGGHALPGTTKFYDVQNPAQLLEALRGIAVSASNCEHELGTTLKDVDQLTVWLDGQQLEQDGDDGWQFVDAERRRIRLRGAACDQLKEGEEGELRAEIERNDCAAASVESGPLS